MSSTPATMLQVVSTGLQDRERLNSPAGKPSLQYYRSVLRKRTRWASQWRRVEFDNLADFGRTAITTIPIIGELITRATLIVELPDIYTPQLTAINQQIIDGKPVVGPSWAWTNSIGHALCADIKLLIDGQIIDQFDSQLLEVIDEQNRTVEHFNSTNTLIGRDPSSFSDQQMIQRFNSTPITQPQQNPQTAEIVIPFWWNRGPGPQALPIQALAKNKVQIQVTFRAVQGCVYTSTRINAANPPLSNNQGAGPLPTINGCGFFISDPSSNTLIYDAASTANLTALGLTNPFPGSVLASPTMPPDYHFSDAYWIMEYVNLEDREAAAFRLGDLEIPIEQHVPLPLVITSGSPRVRIRMDQAGLVRDLTWVAQRVEAPTYNAHFLFSKDLAAIGYAAPKSPCDQPWWPDAQIPNWDYGSGYIRPGFSDRHSDPILEAKMMTRGNTRFESEGVSIFRSLLPALNCARTPLIDRYIYRYDFGYWPTGGLAESLYLPVDQIRGCANWDKLPKRELQLTMNQGSNEGFIWVPDTSQQIQTITGSSFIKIENLFNSLTDGLFVTLRGAHPLLPDGSVDVIGNNGDGAVVEGYIDFTALRRQPGYIFLHARTNNQGSASLVQELTSGYQWIAVAASGGYGLAASGGGGLAGSAVEIAYQGGNGAQSHNSVTTAGGSIIYNTISRGANADATAVSFDSTNATFEMLTGGTVREVFFYFSITNNTQTAAAVDIKLYNLTTSIIYNLTVPTATEFVPVSKFTAFPESPISIAAGDIIYFVLTVIPVPGSMGSPLPFTAFTTSANDPTTLGANMIIDQPPNQVVVPRTFYGGGGGGRLDEAGVGLQDGIQMTTDPAFVVSHAQTGGTTYNFHGGDGYYGGGSGSLAGGGGGSYVSNLINQVNTYEDPDSSAVSITIAPLKRVPTPQPSYNIYSYVTRYNRLRINSGRGVLMFSETT